MKVTDGQKDLEVLDVEYRVRFEQLVLPHLDAAYNLAAWLLPSRSDAEDVTQEAMLHAYRFFPGFCGGNVRAWLLQIVRNTSYTWLEKNHRMKVMDQFNEELHTQFVHYARVHYHRRHLADV
jgi:RNA polymerase sigma-70 factor (ECF subfamily)